MSSSAEDNSDSERVEEHKLTREERKLQAIVKQFEQMENKEHKNKSTSRTSSRKASKDVIEPIEEFKVFINLLLYNLLNNNHILLEY